MKRLSACILTLSASSFGVTAVVSARRAEGDGSPIYGVELPTSSAFWL
jgi:hypothetical protein